MSKIFTNNFFLKKSKIGKKQKYKKKSEKFLF